jgi:hypothetical protein
MRQTGETSISVPYKELIGILRPPHAISIVIGIYHETASD